jgi:hypothetical protein
MTTAPNDEKYYQVTGAGSVGERLLIIARDRIYGDFARCCRPQQSSTILDFGVSDVVNDGANVIERKYPQPENITAVGLSNAPAFRAEYPAVRYVQIAPHAKLPFADKEFDIATSNAVLEHMGSRANQYSMITELLRVARQIFVTVPYRFFPVEHHTAIPLLHYSELTFSLACRVLGKSEWAKDENLILMSRGDLRSLAPTGSNVSIGYTGIRCGPFSSNLYLHIDN